MKACAGSDHHTADTHIHIHTRVKSARFSSEMTNDMASSSVPSLVLLKLLLLKCKTVKGGRSLLLLHLPSYLLAPSNASPLLVLLMWW